MKKIFTLIFLLCFSFLLHGQYFFVGYQAAVLTHAQGNIDIPLCQFNFEHPDATREYTLPLFKRGPAFGLSFAEDVGFELSWDNKHAIAKTETFQNGVKYLHHFKYRLNAFNMGFFVNGERLRPGFQCNFLVFSVWKKNAPSETFDDEKYVRFYNDKPLIFGLTFYCDVLLWKYVFVRPYFQWACMKAKPRSNDDKSYYHNNTNFGIMASFQLPYGND